MICELDANHWYGMMGTRDPVSGDIGTAYGIIQNSDGHWLVDLDDTTNTRVTVKAIDEEQEYFYVVFDSNHIQ